MSREDLYRITERDFVAYNASDGEYKAVAEMRWHHAVLDQLGGCSSCSGRASCAPDGNYLFTLTGWAFEEHQDESVDDVDEPRLGRLRAPLRFSQRRRRGSSRRGHFIQLRAQRGALVRARCALSWMK